VGKTYKPDKQRQQSVFTLDTKSREAAGHEMFALLQTTAKKSAAYE
jgi:hypothetical protein